MKRKKDPKEKLKEVNLYLEKLYFKEVISKISDAKLVNLASSLGLDIDCTSKEIDISKKIKIIRKSDCIIINKYEYNEKDNSVLKLDSLNLYTFNVKKLFSYKNDYLNYNDEIQKEKYSEDEMLTKLYRDNISDIFSKKYKIALNQYLENKKIIEKED